MFNELYILSTNEALARRSTMDIYITNRIVDSILTDLDVMLRECNPLAKAFMNTHAQYLDEVEQARLNHQDKLPSFTMVLLADRKDPGVHPNRVRQLIPNEVCAIYRSIYGEPLVDLPHGQWVRCSETKKLKKIQYFHPNKNALAYPLLLPYGNQTYRDGIALIRPKPNARGPVRSDERDNDEAYADMPASVPRPRKKGPTKFASRRDFLHYILQIRQDPKTVDRRFPIWASGLLGQKYLIGFFLLILFIDMFLFPSFRQCLGD
jgi:hypothetical protein